MDLRVFAVTFYAVGEEDVGSLFVQSAVLDVLEIDLGPSAFSVGIGAELAEEVEVDSGGAHWMPV